MLAKIFLPLLAATLALASPIDARDASPVAAAAPATSSTAAKGTIELITYLASTECEYTSLTSTITANACVDLLTEGESFAFTDFANGKSSCKLEIFSKPGCKGRKVSKVAAGGANVTNTCSTKTGESAKLVC